MSRTRRRNTSSSIRNFCGTLDEAIADPQWIMDRAQLPTIERAYAKKVAMYTGDNRSGKFAPPRWWVRMYYTRPTRRLGNSRLQRSVMCDNGESYLEPINKGAGWFYFWQM